MRASFKNILNFKSNSVFHALLKQPRFICDCIWGENNLQVIAKQQFIVIRRSSPLRRILELFQIQLRIQISGPYQFLMPPAFHDPAMLEN